MLASCGAVAAQEQSNDLQRVVGEQDLPIRRLTPPQKRRDVTLKLQGMYATTGTKEAKHIQFTLRSLAIEGASEMIPAFSSR
jgi:hypothetical protein